MCLVSIIPSSLSLILIDLLVVLVCTMLASHVTILRCIYPTIGSTVHSPPKITSQTPKRRQMHLYPTP